jgi:hypothetical protein
MYQILRDWYLSHCPPDSTPSRSNQFRGRAINTQPFLPPLNRRLQWGTPGCLVEKNLRGVTAGFNTPTFVLDAPGGGGKRCIHSYEYYNRETGVSVYTAPSVKPGQYFMYFDPFHSLSEEIRQAWRDQKKRQQMWLDAIYHSGVGVYSRLA